MAAKKVGIIALLLCATILLGWMPEQATSAKACPLICFNAAYMRCPPTYHMKLRPVCNCCLAKRGCKLYTVFGKVICTAHK